MNSPFTKMDQTLCWRVGLYTMFERFSVIHHHCSNKSTAYGVTKYFISDYYIIFA